MYERTMIPRVNLSNYRLTAKPHEAWGPRTIPDTELVYVHEGVFALEADSSTVTATQGQLIAIAPRIRHVFKSLKQIGTVSCIHCDLPDEAILPVVSACTDPEIEPAFRRCAEAFIHPSTLREELLSTLLNELLIRLRTAAPHQESSPPSERVQAMADYIHRHFDEPVTRKRLAAEFHVSPQHINHLFRVELGTSPTALLHLERSKQAFLLIQNERISVAEAAERTGFCDAYHLSKVFKKVYGFPPGRVSRFFLTQAKH